MGKVLKILGIIFLVLIALGAAALFFAHSAGTKAQEKLFTAFGTGDVDAVIALMHPTLKEEVDKPVFAEFIAACNEKLGAFEKLSASNFDTSIKVSDAGKLTQSKGEVIFEKGRATSELVYLDGQLISLDIDSDLVGDDWFGDDFDTSLYRERGKEFLEKLFNGQIEEASAMMHEEAKAEVPFEKLKADMAELVSRGGALTSVTHQSEELTVGKSPQLTIRYIVQAEKGRTMSMVKFQFVGLKGHLVEFNPLDGDPADVENEGRGGIQPAPSESF